MKINVSSKTVSKINIILIVIFIAAFVIRLYYSDKSIAAGSELGNLQKEIEAFERENQKLQNEYYQLSSLTSLSQRALGSGYVDAAIDYYSSPRLALK